VWSAENFEQDADNTFEKAATFQFGAMAGIGYLHKSCVGLQLRWDQGINPMFTNNGVDFRNNNWMLSLSYRLGKR